MSAVRTPTSVFHNRSSVKHPESAVFPGDFLYLNPYRILCTSNLDDFDCVPPGLASLPGTSLRATRPDVVRDDGEQAKLLCHSGFRETSRNFTYLCWVLPRIERPALALPPPLDAVAGELAGVVTRSQVHMTIFRSTGESCTRTSASGCRLKSNTVEIGASHSLLLPWVCRPTRHQGGYDSHATRTLHAAGR